MQQDAIYHQAMSLSTYLIKLASVEPADEEDDVFTYNLTACLTEGGRQELQDGAVRHEVIHTKNVKEGLEIKLRKCGTLRNPRPGALVLVVQFLNYSKHNEGANERLTLTLKQLGNFILSIFPIDVIFSMKLVQYNGYLVSIIDTDDLAL